jgi:molybdenum cofactor synthesis domain-containing protein
LTLILTTGGTGIARRDVTPEATRGAVDREIPGLSEMMRTAGLQHTRRAVLSRGIAGCRGNTLVINLPGSPSGALQSLRSVQDLIPHAADLLKGKTDHSETL